MSLGLTIKIIYNLVLAVILTFLVGFGISVFYSAPVAPQYLPSCEEIPKAPGLSQTPSQNCKPQAYYDQQQKQYQNDLKAYAQIVSIVALTFSAIFVGIGIGLYRLLPNFSSFSAGVLFGALFTFFYAIGNSTSAANQKLQFAIACVGLVLILVVGYTLFLQKKAENDIRISA